MKMIKLIKFVFILIIATLIIVSCKSTEKTCFNNKKDWNYNIDKLLDTNYVYKQIDMRSKERDTNDLFIKNERLLIKKKKPGIQFYSNGKFAYFTETISTNYKKGAIYGQYRIYNDTIYICREYWSAQGGKWLASSLLIMTEKGFVEKKSTDIILYYEKI